ncbi:MAG: hypothetical protein AB7S71_14895 [Dongiaceae bacterium]
MNAMRWRGRAFAPLLLAAAMSAAVVTEARAAGACFLREAMIAHLAERYGERPIATGVARGHLVLLLSRADGASWTILLVPPGAGGGALACPLAVGEAWRMLERPHPDAVGSPGSSS